MNLKRMRDLREDHDYTQKYIGEYLKITREQYQLYESQKRTIPIDLLSKLAKLYNTSIDYIVGDTNNPERYPEND